MSISSTKSGQIHPLAIAGAALVLLGLFIWLGYRNFGPPPPPPLNPAAQKIDDQLHELAKKCGGDFEKLSDEDKSKAQSMTAGNAKQMLAAIAKE